ncbi:hypothetical protein GQF61_05660 [Sphingobacterium sp. DK4209]|uniref:Collagen-like protein n=1 Tax=Sphingobacterium zhuxiongii TaxID=2662364 RepID=A0A5Q0QGM4_9SPHI|nr:MULTISPECIES: hypothetical protein [unclassified Sphingobacterium]MVZ65333.1 hypothetical protein [Sphingobacterium sp. DK4209]QGA26420.1 hypothetical protein GFH32_08800 [Sphingobacterium sp. dk4302]
MKTKILMILLALIIFAAEACKKGENGAMGPKGDKGDAGAAGTAGATGAKGADGSMFYSGTTVPAATLGKVGDFYFRTSTSDLYGPKKSTGWGTATNIKGDDGKNGTNGKNGSQFLSGTSIPAATLGVVGDFYFNTTQMVLYGPKVATGWGVGTNLKANALAIYSGWRTGVRTKDTIMDGTSYRIQHIYAPQFTASRLENSAILVYLNFGGGVFPLPYTSNAGGRMSTISFQPKLSELLLSRMVYDGGALLNLSSNISYRYVIVPGTTLVGLKKRNINIQDADAVERAINEMEQ